MPKNEVSCWRELCDQLMHDLSSLTYASSQNILCCSIKLLYRQGEKHFPLAQGFLKLNCETLNFLLLQNIYFGARTILGRAGSTAREKFNGIEITVD